jgi:hypothetical protein
MLTISMGAVKRQRLGVRVAVQVEPPAAKLAAFREYACHNAWPLLGNVRADLLRYARRQAASPWRLGLTRNLEHGIEVRPEQAADGHLIVHRHNL